MVDPAFDSPFFCYMLCCTRAEEYVQRGYIFISRASNCSTSPGPTEVFASTSGFKVYTVSVDGQDILSQGLVTVKPQFSIDNAPVADIIVFPGGNSGASSKNEKVIQWAQSAIKENRSVMSVCTGAFILARAGLLDEKNITTHYASLENLQQLLPNATVLADTRFVDNDHIITTAGVSAGIDGALHLVERIKGKDVALATARYMEYDKWHPEEGKIATLNPVLKEMQNQMYGLSSRTTMTEQEMKASMPFEGELTNQLALMNQNGKFQLAADWADKGTKWYPNSAAIYDQKRIAYVQLLKPVPIDETGFMKLVDSGNMEEAKKQYDRAISTYPGWKIFRESVMNDQGYKFLREEKNQLAIAAFELNTKAYPDSGNVWDSLGEAYMVAGNNKEAIKNYEKSLQKDPGNENARAMLVRLKPE
jgi:putative intracellular protease/amidase/protein associated with RNAse G/E